jgi:hypothetical protein
MYRQEELEEEKLRLEQQAIEDAKRKKIEEVRMKTEGR